MSVAETIYGKRSRQQEAHPTGKHRDDLGVRCELRIEEDPEMKTKSGLKGFA